MEVGIIPILWMEKSRPIPHGSTWPQVQSIELPACPKVTSILNEQHYREQKVYFLIPLITNLPLGLQLVLPRTAYKTYSFQCWENERSIQESHMQAVIFTSPCGINYYCMQAVIKWVHVTYRCSL